MDGQNQQNFIKQVPVDTGPSRPPGFYKSIAVDILTVTSAALFSFAYKSYIDGVFGFIIPVITLVVFAMLSSLEVFVIRSLPRRSLILVLEIIALLSFFYDRSDGVLFLTGGLMLLFTVMGEIQSRREFNNSLELRFFAASRMKLVKLMTAVSLMVVTLYLPQITVDNLNIGNIFIGPQGFQSFFSWSSGFISRMYPEIQVGNSTVEQLAKDIASLQLKSAPGFKDLAPSEQELSITKAADELIKQLNNNFETKINGEDTTNQFFYNVIVSSMEKWKNKLGDWFLFGWLVAFFLIARGIGIILALVTAGLTYTLIQLLLGLGFVHLVGESRMKEIIAF